MALLKMVSRAAGQTQKRQRVMATEVVTVRMPLKAVMVIA